PGSGRSTSSTTPPPHARHDRVAQQRHRPFTLLRKRGAAGPAKDLRAKHQTDGWMAGHRKQIAASGDVDLSVLDPALLIHRPAQDRPALVERRGATIRDEAGPE